MACEGGDSGTGEADKGVSASALRWNAAESDHRDCPFVRSKAADRGRTYHCAGCDDSGTDIGSFEKAQG